MHHQHVSEFWFSSKIREIRVHQCIQKVDQASGQFCPWHRYTQDAATRHGFPRIKRGQNTKTTPKSTPVISGKLRTTTLARATCTITEESGCIRQLHPIPGLIPIRGQVVDQVKEQEDPSTSTATFSSITKWNIHPVAHKMHCTDHQHLVWTSSDVHELLEGQGGHVDLWSGQHAIEGQGQRQQLVAGIWKGRSLQSKR